MRVLAAALVWVTLASAAASSADINDALTAPYQPARYAVRINGKVVSAHAPVIISGDDIIYVSRAQLDAWRLKHPVQPSYEHNGTAYFGLQSDLHVRTSFDSVAREVDITAPASAFHATADTQEQARGTFLDYTLTSAYGRYGLFDAGRGGVYELSYISGWDGVNQGLFPSVIRWHRVNPASHTAISVGENVSQGDWIGIDAPFAGVHYASDFSGAARAEPKGAPSIRGIAESPSRVEVYLDGMLLAREDVPAGPFVVRDLPEGAANNDLVVTLTDRAGKRTSYVERAATDTDFLGRGTVRFSLDAGVAHENIDAPHQYYRGGVAQGTLQYALTDRANIELLGESIAGEQFFDTGADVRFGEGVDAGFRIGGGNRRHASEYRYSALAGPISFNAIVEYDSQRIAPIDGLDLGLSEQINEFANLRADIGNGWSSGIDFVRTRNNAGANSAAFSVDLAHDMGPIRVRIAPFYDLLERRLATNFSFDFRLRERSDPNDPLSVQTSISAGDWQERALEIDYDAHWALAQYRLQEWNRDLLSEPYIHGALVHTQSRYYGAQAPGDAESLGIISIP